MVDMPHQAEYIRLSYCILSYLDDRAIPIFTGAVEFTELRNCLVGDAVHPVNYERVGVRIPVKSTEEVFAISRRDNVMSLQTSMLHIEIYHHNL